MQIIKEKARLNNWVATIKHQGGIIGLAPTMGALHEGHLSLIRQAASVCDWVVVSIFINPTQFDKPLDLQNYPQTLDKDIALLQELDLNIVVFSPIASELYGDKIETDHFEFDGVELEMEGKYRFGHFDGVGTVVKKLFEIIQPDKAFFGEKDFQQLQIIRKLIEKTGLPVEIIGCPIYRESSGLARSSRNERLSDEIRQQASFIYQTLLKAKEKFGTESAKQISNWVENEFKTHAFLKLEYFEIADSNSLKTIENKQLDTPYRAFIAVYAGEVRLIDNIALNY
ncbi:MAG TPA: pantoate--beta-alanine ligase [Gillisia sp.]|nr:pantoate--beta-alanine ligase [Gillisia sp.]